MPFIDINDAKLSYNLIGPPDGDLIITLHGGRGQGSKERSFDDLHHNNYRILSFDFRGHGESSKTPPYTFGQLAADVEELRRQFGGEKRCIIIGGLFGLFIALHYAIHWPQSLSHLVLRGAAPSHHHESNAYAELDRFLSDGSDARPKTGLKSMLDRLFSGFDSDLEFRLTMFALAPLYATNYNADKTLASNLSTVFNADVHRSLYSPEEKYFDYRDSLDKISVPTLIIVGENDWICPPEQSKIIASGIKNSTLEIVEGCNHSVQVEKKEYVLKLISEFLKE